AAEGVAAGLHAATNDRGSFVVRECTQLLPSAHDLGRTPGLVDAQIADDRRHLLTGAAIGYGRAEKRGARNEVRRIRLDKIGKEVIGLIDRLAALIFDGDRRGEA